MQSGDNGIRNVALYMRVSTEDQAREGFSLESQLQRLRDYCKAMQWTVSGEYVDGGYSGRNVKRPMYQEMFTKMDQWDAIVVIKMDRIHRNRLNFITMMQMLRKTGKQFVSMTESLDTSTAMGRFVMGIIQDIAQLESEQTGERVYIAQAQKATKKDAGFMGHRVPYGYRWDTEKHVFIEVPEELEIIKTVFRLYLEGKSMREIAKIVGKTNTTVKYFLHNCFYAGAERWCHLFKKADIKPLVSIEVFNQVQMLMRSRCLSHRHYKPMLIKDKETFTLSKEDRNCIPVINRAKHNFTF